MTAARETHSRLQAGILLVWFVITMLFWLMAFYRAPEATPEWLLRAQSACFGTAETGLPDTYGWLVLTLGPLSFLLGLFVAMGSEVYLSLATVIRTGIGRTLAGALLAALLWEGVWIERRVEEGLTAARAVYDFGSAEDLPANYPRTRRPAAPFHLVDQHGSQVSPAAFRGKVTLLTFAFAHCATVCPAILKNVLEAADSLSPHQVEVLVVTLDPWRDTPGTLPALASHWGLSGNAHVLSGDVDQVVQVLDQYQVPRERDPQTGDIVHPALVYLLDPAGDIAYSFNSPHPRWLSQAAAKLLADGAGFAVDKVR